MRHDLHIEGAAFRLRPVTAEDAEAIVALRSDPKLSRFIHAVSPKVEDQLSWIKRYEIRQGDYYFAVERVRDRHFEGTLGIYDVADDQGEWGRWVLRAGSLAATESALLMYRIAFEMLKLKSLYCRTVAANATVLSFHDRCGLTRKGLISNAFELPDGPVDAVEHTLSLSQWPVVEAYLSEQAQKIAKLVQRG